MSGTAVDSEQARPAPRLLACCVLGCVFGIWSHPGRAETALCADIPPQPVAGALTEFARQTGLQFIYVSRIAKERISTGVRAGMTSATALPALLDGTGLGFEFLNSRTVRLFESAPNVPTGQPVVSKASNAPVKRHSPWFVGLDEIVVIGARDRDAASTLDDAQNIAASVSLLSGDSLEAQKLEQLTDYAAYLPGVNVVNYGAPGNSQILLRGISSFYSAATGAYYLDDTPMGPSGPWANACCDVLDLMPYDLERLEVWRGPQGTHFGAGSETGVIRFALEEPSVSGFEARVGADASAINGASRAGASLRFMVNDPLVADVLAVRVSAYDSYTPGYIDNAYRGTSDDNAVRRYGGRIAIMWRPDSSVSVKIAAFWPRIYSDSQSDVSSTGVAVLPDTGDAYVVRSTGSYGDLTNYHAFLQPFTKAIDYYSATVHWNPASLEVTSATAWSKTGAHNVYDRTFEINPDSAFPVWSDGAIQTGLAASRRDITFEKFSEELRVVSQPGQHVDWLLGGFFTRESASDQTALYAYDLNYQPIALFAPALTANSTVNTYKEFAGFGESTWHVTEQFDLTGGIRYAHDEQQVEASDSSTIFGSDYVAGGSKEGVTTWMAAARYHFTPEAMLYGRVGTGSQPGSMNGVVPGVPPNVKAETVTNYELGLKSELLERKVLVDLSVFNAIWKDIQLVLCFEGGCGFGSGANAVSRGLELTTTYSPLEGLRLGYNAAFTRSELTTVLPGPGNFLPGYQLANVPRSGMSLTGDYDWEFTDAWHAHVGGAFRWIGQRWSESGVSSASAGGSPTMELSAYSLLDLNASIANGPLILRIFLRNLTDTRAKSQGIVLGDPYYPPAALELRILQPRTIGIGFDYAL